MRTGSRNQDPLFTVYVVPNTESEARLGVTVSRRVSARAVDRNRLKRRIRESFRHFAMHLGGLDIVVVAKPAARTAKTEVLCASLQDHWTLAGNRCKAS